MDPNPGHIAPYQGDKRAKPRHRHRNLRTSVTLRHHRDSPVVRERLRRHVQVHGGRRVVGAVPVVVPLHDGGRRRRRRRVVPQHGRPGRRPETSRMFQLDHGSRTRRTRDTVTHSRPAATADTRPLSRPGEEVRCRKERRRSWGWSRDEARMGRAPGPTLRTRLSRDTHSRRVRRWPLPGRNAYPAG